MLTNEKAKAKEITYILESTREHAARRGIGVAREDLDLGSRVSFDLSSDNQRCIPLSLIIRVDRGDGGRIIAFLDEFTESVAEELGNLLDGRAGGTGTRMRHGSEW